MKRKSVWAGLVMGVAVGVMLSSTTVAATEAEPAPLAYMSCGETDMPCAYIGARVRCYYIYPTEPGICLCTNNGTWSCT